MPVAHGNAAQRHRLEQLHSPFAALGLLLPLSVHGRPFLDNSHGSQSASREVGMLPNHGEATTGLIISPRTDSSTTRAPMFSACAKRRKSGRGRMSVHAHTAPDSRGEPPLSVHRPARLSSPAQLPNHRPSLPAGGLAALGLIAAGGRVVLRLRILAAGIARSAGSAGRPVCRVGTQP